MADARMTQSQTVRARMARPDDAGAAAGLLVRACPPLDRLGPALAELLTGLIAADAIRCGIIEEADGKGGWTVRASGSSLFVPDAVADEILAGEAPFCTARLMERMANGEAGLALGEIDIGRANAGHGLNLFVLGFAHGYAVDTPALRILLARSIEHFVEAHRGFRLKSVLREDSEETAAVLLQSGMRMVRTFTPEQTGERARVLMVRRADDDRPLFPDSTTSRLFAYAPPVILFTSAERRLLEQAMTGLPDDEIAAELGLSINTVKRMWKSVYDRTLSRAPHLFGADAREAPGESGVRGAEKRRHLLNHLREHPEELRPYARQA